MAGTAHDGTTHDAAAQTLARADGSLTSAALIAAQIGALVARIPGLLAAGDPAGLARAAQFSGEIRRLTDAIGIEVAGRLDRLWRDDETRAAVRALGEKSVAKLVQVSAGIDSAEASAWARIARAVQPRISLTGETLPARHASVSRALEAGELRVSGASRVLEVVEHIEPHSTLDEREAVERFLVDQAPNLTDRQFARACAEMLAAFQPENQAHRETLLRSKCGVWVRQRSDGITETLIRSTGTDTGFLLTAMDAQTAPRRRVTLVPSDEPELEPDRRPLADKRLDAIVSMARRSLGADDGTVAGASVTMRVTMGLEELRTGHGSAQISGLDVPISAAEARRLAADAEIIPVVLGSASVTLDMGRTVRLATPSQRDALAIRDGGCIWPQCEAPPGWCEVAHIIPWADGGATDLSNLVLFCPFHHRCFDTDGWELSLIRGERYLVPPPWVDPARVPRRAGPAPTFVT